MINLLNIVFILEICGIRILYNNINDIQYIIILNYYLDNLINNRFVLKIITYKLDVYL